MSPGSYVHSPWASFLESVPGFFLLSLKGGLFLRHLEQNKYIFQINVQRLELVRQGKKNNGASVF